MAVVRSIEQLEALYGKPVQAATVKVSDHITDPYRAFIEAAPYLALATSGPEGLDCSPRGDEAGRLVRVDTSKKLLLPDRRGNNRVDSLRNIIRDPRVALLFMVPGVNNTIRVNGKATLDIDPSLLASFVIDGKLPRSVIIVEVEEVYFQCARALIRSDLWNSGKHVDASILPSPGQILECMSTNAIDGQTYDLGWAERAKTTMW